MITSIDASAAAHPIGLPPYVPPWLPFGQRAMISARAPSAENGNPDAMPLAMHSTSGSMPACVTANISPVRPNPDCTSSAMNRIPCSRHRVRELLQEACRCGDVATFAEHRLDDDGRGLGRCGLRQEQMVEAGKGAVDLRLGVLGEGIGERRHEDAGRAAARSPAR